MCLSNRVRLVSGQVKVEFITRFNDVLSSHHPFSTLATSICSSHSLYSSSRGVAGNVQYRMRCMHRVVEKFGTPCQAPNRKMTTKHMVSLVHNQSRIIFTTTSDLAAKRILRPGAPGGGLFKVSEPPRRRPESNLGGQPPRFRRLGAKISPTSSGSRTTKGARWAVRPLQSRIRIGRSTLA